MSRIVVADTGIRPDWWRLGAGAFALVWMVLLAPSAAPIQAAGAQQSPTTTPAVSPQRALLNQYCVGCHNQRQKAAGATPIALDTLDLSNLGGDAETWEKVVRKVRAGLMPPAGRPRPDQATHDGFAAWLEGGARPRRGGEPESRPDRAVPSAQSRRVPERHPRSARTSTWTSSRCCRPTMSATGSTISPAC